MAASDAQADAMQLGGQFGVSETGAANYKIPVAVPPGTGGMVPALSLDYDSQSSNGIVGMGWTLNGLLSITRCPTTVAQDGIDGRIGYDANDRYCMDGHRLIVISGTYGADNAEYRTDVDGFSKVISHGTAGSGPAWFEVKTKSGQTMQFGNTTDSAILAAGTSTVRLWGLNKVTDTKGNYLTITYDFTAGTSSTPAEYYPSRIDYTGNAAASLVPYASVQFFYDTTRLDKMTAYQAGSSLAINKRLTNIKTYVGTDLVMDYQLAYASGSSTGNARLTSVTACGGDGACLPATTFWWSDVALQYYDFNYDPTGGNGGIGYWTDWTPWNPTVGAAETFGDVNGDGIADVLYNNNGTLSLSLSNRAGGVWSPSLWPAVATGISTAKAPQLLDLVGHGHDDLLVQNAQNQVVLYPANGSGFDPGSTLFYFDPALFPYAAVPALNGDDYTPRYGDVNADGHPDMLFHDKHNQFYVALWNAAQSKFDAATLISSLSGSPFFAAVSNVYPDVETRFANFTGRGQNDLLLIIHSTSTAKADQIFYAKANGTSWDAPVQVPVDESLNKCGTVYLKLKTQAVDWNRDGLDDLFVSMTSTASCGTAGARYRVYLSNGNAPAVTGPTATLAACDKGLQVADLGSGRLDIVCGNGLFIYADRSTASSVDRRQIAKTPTSGPWFMVDLNGDANPDLVNNDSSNHLRVALAHVRNPGRPDLMTAINTGLGIQTFVRYDSIAHAPNYDYSSSSLGNSVVDPYGVRPIYTAANASTFPIVDLMSPLYVVAQVDVPDGKFSSTPYRTQYRYGGAQADVTGRGFLGFRQLTVADPQTGIDSTTTFRLDYPYIGMKVSETKSVNGALLSQTDSTYSNITLGSGPATRVFPYLSQQVDRSWDLDGTPLPTVTSAFQYDTYGNATQTMVLTPDGNSKVTTNTYTNDTSNWFLGRLTRATVTADNEWSSTWVPTTAANTVDPKPFFFQAVVGVPPSSSINSNVVTLSGFSGTLTATVTGGQVKVNGGTAVTSASVASGDAIQLVATSSADIGGTTTPSIKIGSYATGFWSISTANSGKVVFSTATAGTAWTVPAGVNRITVKSWGAGGGGGAFKNDPGGNPEFYYTPRGGYGGSGGFVSSSIPVLPGQSFIIVVGEGGTAGNVAANTTSGGGGGYSGVFTGPPSQSTALFVSGAGGGGGTGNLTSNGGDGGPAHRYGTDGYCSSAQATANQCGLGGGMPQYELIAGGEGGLRVNPGTAGTALKGGAGGGTGGTTGYMGGSGGAGWYGGGGAGSGYYSASVKTGSGGGGGGSNWARKQVGTKSLWATAGSWAPNKTDPDYIALAGDGGDAALTVGTSGSKGRDGLVVISYYSADTSTFSFTPVTNATLNTQLTSNAWTVPASVTTPVTATPVGALIKVNGGTAVTSASVVAGNTIELVAISANDQNVTTTASVSIGTFAVGQWSITTTSNGKATFSTAGTNTWTVPAGVTSITVKAWAGGGGSGNRSGYPGYTGAGVAGVAGDGGGGGYLSGTFAVTPGQVLNVVVGAGGFGGYQGTNTGKAGGIGGGYSGVFTGTPAQGTALAVAGAGGGGGIANNTASGGDGGAGGGASGVAGTAGTGGSYAVGQGGGGGTASAGGAGATGAQSNPGTAGSALTGGPAGGIGGNYGSAGGAGGGGWYGGGGAGGGYYGGDVGDPETGSGGGGGGSSKAAASGTSITNTAGSGRTPGNTGDADYLSGRGTGGLGSGTANTRGSQGGSGLVVIRWNP